MNNEPSISPDMMTMEKLDKSIGESPDLWLRLAAEDYVTTRVLMLSGLYRLGAYHTQQTVEKYLKAFILKQYGIEFDNKINGYKIKSYKDNKLRDIKFNMHNLDKLLNCCQQKNNFFKEERVRILIDTLYMEKQLNQAKFDFNEIRYNYKFTIDLTTKIPKILPILDYFVKNVRELVNADIRDVIGELQERHDINLNELGFAGELVSKDLGKFFFEENSHF